MLSIILNACSSSKNTTQTVSERNLKGTWILNNVSYDTSTGNEKLKITLFEDADINCFDSSIWVLPYNSYGSYTIAGNGVDCNSGERKMIWSVINTNGETIFQFKKLDDGAKARDVAEGYKMKVVSLVNDNLLLQSQVNTQDTVLTLNYNYSRK